MTEKQAVTLKDIFFRIKQFYYGVSEKPLSAANMTAGEATEYIAALKEAEDTLFLSDGDQKLSDGGRKLSDGDRQLSDDAEGMLRTLCEAVRSALAEKNIRLAGDLAALGVRLLGVYTFPYMSRRDFVRKCLVPLREKHGI